ncbi:hypothetical protein WN48_01961 [Eufriesea mexicana]|uniref:Uncharacterized protein n=1 Tax=Eufriesea mexicana TaxID=516756 RepID=A0A310SQX4_9HYME|nr:hypothetical protein WN48_01961 [Eufriesea mexicana]
MSFPSLQYPFITHVAAHRARAQNAQGTVPFENVYNEAFQREKTKWGKKEDRVEEWGKRKVEGGADTILK